MRSAFPLLPGVALRHACSQIVSARDRLAPTVAHGSHGFHAPMAVPLALPAAVHRLAEGLPDGQLSDSQADWLVVWQRLRAEGAEPLPSPRKAVCRQLQG